MARQLARSNDKQQKDESKISLSKKQVRGLREVALILLSALAIFLLSALATYNPVDPAWSHSTLSRHITNAGGVVGAWFADVTYFLFGYLAYVFPLVVFGLGWRLFRGKKEENVETNALHVFLVLIGVVFVVATATGISAMHFNADSSILPANSGGGAGVSELTAP